MSCNYAEGLSPYENKGRLGLPERFDTEEEAEVKIAELAELIRNAKHVVVHTGAGISTSAGIPDFRGPKGVWTLEEKGLKPEVNVDWDEACPTVTHMALAKLAEVDKIKFIITQNIDGLHLRSGVARTKIAELHGNMFVDQCDKCQRMFVRGNPAPTVGQRYIGSDCPGMKGANGRKCRGKLRDFVLDWEAALPDDDLTFSDTHSMMADLSIVMGSTLQIIPAGNLPTYTKKYQDGKLVICNLQPTKHTKKADLNIHTYVDDVMIGVMKRLGLEIPEYERNKDPVYRVKNEILPEEGFIEWTQSSEEAKLLKKAGDKVHADLLARKRLEKKRKSSGASSDGKWNDELATGKKSNKLMRRPEEPDVKPEPVLVEKGCDNDDEMAEVKSEKDLETEEKEIPRIPDPKTSTIGSLESKTCDPDGFDLKPPPAAMADIEASKDALTVVDHVSKKFANNGSQHKPPALTNGYLSSSTNGTDVGEQNGVANKVAPTTTETSTDSVVQHQATSATSLAGQSKAITDQENASRDREEVHEITSTAVNGATDTHDAKENGVLNTVVG